MVAKSVCTPHRFPTRSHRAVSNLALARKAGLRARRVNCERPDAVLEAGFHAFTLSSTVVISAMKGLAIMAT